MDLFIEKKFKLLLLLVITVNCLLKFSALDKYSFWSDYDEYYSATTATGFYYNKIPKQQYVSIDEIQSASFQDRLHDAARDNGNSFTYNLLLYFISGVFGESDLVFRLFSYACHIISVLLVVSIGNRLGISKTRVLIAAIVFSTFPILFSFSGIVRAYSLGVMIVLLIVRFLMESETMTSSSRIVASMACLTFLLFTTHYLSYYVLLFIFIYYLARRKESAFKYNRILIGIIVGGFLSVVFLFASSGVNGFVGKSDSYKSHAESGDATVNTRNVKPLTAESFFETLPSYLNRYYLGDKIIPWFAKKYGGEKLELLSCVLCLFLPLIFLVNLQWRMDYRKWQVIFVWLFLAGNISVVLLSLLSGHLMALGNTKYSMFTIPFFILTATFFVRKNKLVLLAATAFFCLTTYSHYAISTSKNIKMIKVELQDGTGKKEYAPSDYLSIQQSVDKTLSKVDGDTIYVNKAADLVFIKNVTTSFRFKTAYILEFDVNRTFEEKVVPISFTVPS